MAEMKLEKILKNRVKLLLNFFFKVKSWGVLVCFILLVIGAVASYFTVPYQVAHIISGCVTAVFFVLFLLAILRLFNKNITQEEAEAVFAHDRSQVYEELFRNLSLEKLRSKYQAEPIELICPEEYPRINTIVYRYFPETSKLFYSQIRYSWLLFGEKSMYYYHASVNHIYGYTGYEGSYEFDYKDIVSIKTLVTHENHVEKFVLTLSLVNGETLEIPLRTAPNKVYESTHKLSEKEAHILSTIRNVIRSSK
jgi:hypothetical protein